MLRVGFWVTGEESAPIPLRLTVKERDFVFDHLRVRMYYISVMMGWTGVVGLTPDTGERQRGRSQGSLSHWTGRMYQPT